jgi:hypothetical protein
MELPLVGLPLLLRNPSREDQAVAGCVLANLEQVANEGSDNLFNDLYHSAIFFCSFDL